MNVLGKNIFVLIFFSMFIYRALLKVTRVW